MKYFAKTVFGKILEKATKLENANTTPGTTTGLHQNFMNGIADYLEQHVKFFGTFTGSNGTSTLTTPVTSTLTATTLRPVVLSGGGGFEKWCETFYTAIQTKPCILPGTFIPSGTIPVFPSISMSWTQQDLANAVGGSGEEAHGNAMDRIGEGLIKDMKLGYIKSVSGAVGAYVGALTVTNITCD